MTKEFFLKNDSKRVEIISDFLHEFWSSVMCGLITTDKQYGYFRGYGDYVINSHRVKTIRKNRDLKYNELDDEERKHLDLVAEKLLGDLDEN